MSVADGSVGAFLSFYFWQIADTHPGNPDAIIIHGRTVVIVLCLPGSSRARWGCRQRLVGAGFSVLTRCCTPVLLTAPLAADGDLPLPADTWVIDAGACVSEEHALPTLCMSHLSLMTSPAGLGFLCGFFPSRQTGKFSVLCLLVSRYKSSQLASPFIGLFSDHLVPAVRKGVKPLSGTKSQLLPLHF